MTRRITIVGVLLCALVGLPRPASAGILDFIWEMSGPQFIGLGYGCLVPIRTDVPGRTQCRIGSVLAPAAQAANPKDQRLFVALSASIFGSTGKDSPTQAYRAGELWMVAVEPGLAVRSYNPIDEVQVHHGVGISYDVLFGKDIQAFDKFAITVTPVDVTLNRVAFGVKLRLYPNGFTDDEFKPGPKVDRNRPFETTLGFTFSYILRK